MTNKFQVNGENLFYNKKLSSPEKIDQSEHDKKSLRILQLIFQRNLNKFIRKNKQPFGGALEVPPNRPVLTKQQYQNNKKVLDNIDDYIERLVKSMVSRNSYLEKQFKSFQEGYRICNSTPALQNPEPDSQNQNQQGNTVLIVCQNTNQDFDCRLNLSQYKTTGSRPFSATMQTRPTSIKRPSLKLTSRPLTSQGSKQIRQRHSLNLKNVDIHKIKLDRQPRKVKVPLFRQSLGQIEDYEKYVQQQVYIRKKKIIPDNFLQNDNKILRTGSAFYSKRGDKPSIINRFRNVTNSKQFLNEIQKQRLHNKIMMVNTVLAFNLNQAQGYKPKSKCWTNNIS